MLGIVHVPKASLFTAARIAGRLSTRASAAAAPATAHICRALPSATPPRGRSLMAGSLPRSSEVPVEEQGDGDKITAGPAERSVGPPRRLCRVSRQAGRHPHLLPATPHPSACTQVVLSAPSCPAPSCMQEQGAHPGGTARVPGYRQWPVLGGRLWYRPARGALCRSAAGPGVPAHGARPRGAQHAGSHHGQVPGAGACWAHGRGGHCFGSLRARCAPCPRCALPPAAGAGLLLPGAPLHLLSSIPGPAADLCCAASWRGRASCLTCGRRGSWTSRGRRSAGRWRRAPAGRSLWPIWRTSGNCSIAC